MMEGTEGCVSVSVSQVTACGWWAFGLGAGSVSVLAVAGCCLLLCWKRRGVLLLLILEGCEA